MEWLNRLRRRFSPASLGFEDAPVIMPDKSFKTTEYLYHAGFFGSGGAADRRLNQAAHLIIAERAFKGWPHYDATSALASLDALLAETGLAAQSPAMAARLRELVSNPPSVDAAMQLSAKAGGFMDDALWVAKRGNTRAAAQAWADIAATQQALRAIAAYDNAKAAESKGMISKAQHMRHVAGLPLDYPDLVGEAGLGHVLHSAIYNLEHPEQFRSTLKDHKNLLQQAYVLSEELKPQGKNVSFGDMLAGSGLLVGSNGEPLGRDSTRMALDAALIQKQADRMRLIAMAVPDDLYTPPQDGDELRQYLLMTADRLMDVSEKIENIPQNWSEHRIGSQQRAAVIDELGMMLNSQRQGRAMLSDRAHSMASEVWELARNPQTSLETLQTAARNLTQLRDAATGMAAAADITQLQALEKIGKQGDMGLNGRLAATQQQLVQVAGAMYPPELLQHFQSGPQAAIQYQQGVLNALINGPQRQQAVEAVEEPLAVEKMEYATAPDVTIPANAHVTALQNELSGLPQVAAEVQKQETEMAQRIKLSQ
jgi:hypothetical protein